MEKIVHDCCRKHTHTHYRLQFITQDEVPREKPHRRRHKHHKERPRARTEQEPTSEVMVLTKTSIMLPILKMRIRIIGTFTNQR